MAKTQALEACEQAKGAMIGIAAAAFGCVGYGVRNGEAGCVKVYCTDSMSPCGWLTKGLHSSGVPDDAALKIQPYKSCGQD